MYRLSFNVIQLRHPLPDVLPVRIEPLALQCRVEDPEVRLGIHARAGAEAPSTVIGSEVTINEVFHQVSLAHAPVDQKVFGEEGRGCHACAVMHVACVIELAHSGIDEREASAAFAPSLEEVHVVFPFYLGVFWFVRLVHANIEVFISILCPLLGAKATKLTR